MKAIYVAVDAMGGDVGVAVTIPAVIKALQICPELHVKLVGHRDRVLPQMNRLSMDPNRVEFIHAEETVAMGEAPAYAVRRKKRSSMRMAIDLVKSGEAQACVSAGNTGALMAMGHFVLKTIAGIERPAIIAKLPSANGSCRMLDLGANTEASPSQLLQFALMGHHVVKLIDGHELPRVGLLNIGSEPIKGTDTIKQAAALMANCPDINYVGFVEAHSVFEGHVDLVVCDGFSGNVAIKSSEGAIRLLTASMKSAFQKNACYRLVGLLCSWVLRDVKEHFMNPCKYNGASLVGLRKILIKSHGAASVDGFVHALTEAVRQVKHNIPQLIQNSLSSNSS